MNYQNPTIPDVLLISLVGFVTVFLVLVVLMCIIMLISSLFSDNKSTAVTKTEDAVLEENSPTVDSYTGVKLYGVSDRDAAILMAIVAHNLDKPLDNLRFISIKEVK